MKLKQAIYGIVPVLLLLLSSCLGNGDDSFDYEKWYQENVDFINKAEAETLDGKKVYEKVIPNWDPASFVLMKWNNDKAETENGIKPMANSTIKVKYLLTDIKGDTIDSSYALADSLFTCRPNEMITGFWIATTNMHVGDSVSTVIPFTCGYGAVGSAGVMPFSTLIFQIKLAEISAYDSKH